MQVLLALFLLTTNAGVIVVDNVWFYGDDQEMRTLGTGNMVEIIEYVDDLVEVAYDKTIGKVHKGVLIDLAMSIAEEKLFVFARGYFDEGEFAKAASLFDVFMKVFAKSRYLAEVLYYYGLSNEQAARQLTPTDSLPGFVFNNNYNTWYYSGEAYEQVIDEFPRSVYASKAAYRFLLVKRMRHLPWRDSLQAIQEELEQWQEFVLKYKNTEEYVLALLEIGYLNRVLFEITEDLDYKRDAITVFQKISDKYPNSVYSAQSKVNLYEIEKGENIYKY